MLDYIQANAGKKVSKKKRQVEGQQPFAFMMPESSWVPPTSFPDLAAHNAEIAIDTETFDPRLKTQGPGFLRPGINGMPHDGFVVGVGVAVGDWKGYFPVAHEGGNNLDRAVLSRWLGDQLGRSDRRYIFANAQYDLGWLRTLGVEVRGGIDDIQIADTLLDEENPAGYSLDALCRRWLGETKEEALLKNAANALGYDNPKAVMHKIPAKYVGTYGERDPDQTFRVWQRIKAHPEWPGLAKVYGVESKLVRTLFEMMWRGVRVDLKYGEQLNERWKKEEQECYRLLGFTEIWNDEVVRRHFKSLGFDHGGSLDKGFLETVAHDHGRLVRKARELNRCRATFLEQNLLQNSVKGRIHPQYVQLASDEGGTRTGRLSCKNPNAQQFPKRSGLIDSKSIRKCLIPEDGCEWAKFDYWSQEPVIQCHYGLLENLPGAENVARQFAENRKLYSFIEQATGGRCNYDQAKAVVLGRSYGMGKAKMASSLHMDIDQCGEILEAFDQVVGYIGILANRFSDRAKQRGWIKTLLGRRRHFNLWQPERERGSNEYFTPLPLEKAKAEWPNRNLERAFTYKAFNAGIQGGAADQTKAALVAIHESVGLPQMTVHDEISGSVTNRAAALAMKEIMENIITLRLPARADMDLGVSWC